MMTTIPDEMTDKKSVTLRRRLIAEVEEIVGHGSVSLK